ncbi:alpha/beta fold hydrolase, partial [Candidatus Parcubacteria bacterium]
MKIILIHGYKANPQSNFFPWLKGELRKMGHEVMMPELPNADNPDPEEWTKFLLDEVGVIDDETIILGHSLGAPAALRFLEAAEAIATPRACILVSPPWMIKNEQFRGFFLSELDFDVLMWKARRFVVIHSKDDDKIPFDHAQKYAKVLQATLVEREGEGHYLGDKYP